jgi:dolichol-phosphate mannosyltransferase
MDKLISVIIPTYNEKDNLEPLVEQVDRALAGEAYEIVFIDDNSRDGTAELAEALAKKYPVRVIVRKTERGLASAVVHGFAQARGELLAVMDADLQHPPAVLRDMVKAAREGADLVIASRYVAGGSCEGWGLTRRVISKGAIFLAHLLLPPTRRIGDPMAGYFLLRKSVVEAAALKPSGYKILLEVLLMGCYQKVVEVPYSFRVREKGESKLKASTQIDYLKHLFSLMRRTGEITRFVKFALVGASGIVVNEGLLWLLHEGLASMSLLAANAISIETSVITNYVLNDSITFRDRRKAGAGSFLSRLGRFNLVSLVGLGINLGITALLTNVAGLHYLVSNLVGIAIAMLWNYLVNLGWTWK